jgi:hypothetical protein
MRRPNDSSLRLAAIGQEAADQFSGWQLRQPGRDYRPI